MGSMAHIEQDDSFWDGLPELVGRAPDMVHGAPVLRDAKGKLTRLPADAVVDNVEGYIEAGMTEDQAIAATLTECYPQTPGGEKTIRALLAYQAERIPQHQI